MNVYFMIQFLLQECIHTIHIYVYMSTKYIGKIGRIYTKSRHQPVFIQILNNVNDWVMANFYTCVFFYVY